MPELPEIKAHAERLAAAFGGAVLDTFTPLSFSVLKTAVPSPADAIGMTLSSVSSRGKFLIVSFVSEDDAPGPVSSGVDFVVHLMQAGRLIPDEKQSAKPRNGLARWRFGDGRALLLTEAGKERKAGIWVLGDALGEPAGASDSYFDRAPFEGLGPDADSVTVEQLQTALSDKNQRLHGFLRDQHGVAGLGRMLANEICHDAKLSPFAMTSMLCADDVAVLHAAIGARIDFALAHERALDAMSKSADRPGAVHRRKGAVCPVCGDTIRAVEYSSYEVDYCPTCQTGGKILADNTTSKFLK